MRKHYIDNLRNAVILLLFPVHTFMIWNDFGSGFYIWQGENRLLSTGIVLVNPWFMPLLFVLAGISARYALEKRTKKEFILQRTHKLLIPFVGGLLLLVPFQTLYARKFFYQYNGGIFEHWKYFFTHVTDFTGYDGAFTPGHLWFILFLLIISLFSLMVFRFLPYEKAAHIVEKMPVLAIAGLFIPIWLMCYLGNFGGFSLGKDFALYLAGYYILSNDIIMEKLEKSIIFFTGAWIAGTLILEILYYRYSYYGDLWVNFIGWISVLTLLAAGKKFFNRRTKFTEYFNKASYPIYLLHQSILVVLAYYVVELTDGLFAQIVCICMGSFLLTVAAYHCIRLVPFVRRIVGVNER